MFQLTKPLAISALITVISACGGGSSSDSDGESGKNSTSYKSILAAPEAYTLNEVYNAYATHAENEYTGTEATAETNVASTQAAYGYLTNTPYYEMPDLAPYLLIKEEAEPLAVDETLECYNGGTVRVIGEATSDNTGTMNLYFSDCDWKYYTSNVNGHAAVILSSYSEQQFEIDYFYDDLTWYNAELAQNMAAAGRVNVVYQENAANDDWRHTTTENLTIQFGSRSVRSEISQQQGYENGTWFTTISGEYTDNEVGKVVISSEDLDGTPMYQFTGEISFKGTSTAAVYYDNGNFVYAQDTDSDGELDSGFYAYDASNFANTTYTNITLSPLDEMSLPPYADNPYFYSYEPVYTANTITVDTGYYSDNDTPYEDLVVSFNWYLNGELIEGEHTDTLPAYIAVYGDKLEVSMTVSDGYNLTESSKTTITIADSPAQLSTVGLPENVSTNTEVSFTLEIIDPDVQQGEPASASLVAGPEGASIDDSGTVTWTTPESLFFPEQNYLITFALNDSEQIHNLTVEISVTSDASLPIVRHGVQVPQFNDSMWIGDIDGDDVNEVIATDSRTSVYSLKENNGAYEMDWAYPFAMPSDGNIKQVLLVNLDNDDKDEILVVTDHGLSLIENKVSLATTLLDHDDYISTAAIADLDNDGDLEIVLVTQDSDYTSDKTLEVRTLPDAELLFSTAIGDVRDVEIGNTDNDDALEIVLNTGLIYDGATYNNEWYSSTAFADGAIAVGDFNNDGIEEIVGAARWGDVIVFSAVSKSQLASFDNFNTCDVIAANIDGDAADEVILGDCQWGAIHAYDLGTSALEQKWSIDMIEHGSHSIAVGDSDNDGNVEVHWTSGQSSSGRDIFAAADISADAATLKEASISVQYGQVSSAGWAEVRPGEESAIFFIPDSNSGYDGSRLAFIGENNTVQLSDVISSNWDNSSSAITSDFNQDGYGDIFLPSTTTYDGSFAAMQLDDMSIHWQASGDYDDNIGIIQAFDLNNDDYEDAVYVNSQKLTAINLIDQTIIFNHSFGNNISDFSITEYNDSHYVAITGYEKTTMYKLLNGSLSELYFMDTACRRIEFYNYDDDAQPEIACAVSTDYWYEDSNQLKVFEFDDSSFTETSSIDTPYYITDLAIDSSSENSQNLYIGSASNDDYDYYWNESTIYHLHKTDSAGYTIWRSPKLIGGATHRGIKQRVKDGKEEIMMSTSRAMYLFK